MLLPILLATTMSVLLPSTVTAQGVDTPVVTDVRAESLESPAYVATDSPRFSWQIQRGRRGVSQTKYQIRIGQLHAWPAILAYDSGVITSNASTLVDIGTTTLMPGHTYLASVQVWDEFDTPSPPSEPLQFTIAPDDTLWSAATPVWDGTNNSNNYAFFRDQFTIGAAARKVTTYVSVNRSYRLFVNGHYLGTGPARSDLNRSLLVNAYDLTEEFQVGTHTVNTLAIEAHYLGAVPGGSFSGWPAARWMTIVEDNQGNLTVVGSDPASANLKVLATTPWDENAPIRGPAFGQASAVESYDGAMAAAVAGWQDPSFDDSSWSSAISMGVPDYDLMLQEVPNRIELPSVPVGSITYDVATDAYIVDLGYLTMGWPNLVMHNTQADDVIRIHYSDRLDKQGLVLRGDGPNGITDNYDEYIAVGAASESWSPHYWEAFQFMEITGLRAPLTLQDITVTPTQVPLENPLEDGFESSNTLLEDIYEISYRTQIACIDGLFMDTPQRERKQYMADGFIQAMNVAYTFDSPHFLRKLSRDAVAFGARFSGIIPAASPVDSPGFIAEWALHYPLAVWKQYELYGDARALEEQYVDLVAVKDVFELQRHPTNGLVTGVPGFTDWPLSSVDSTCATRTALNAFYYGTLRILEQTATHLGHATDAQDFGALADGLRTAINTHLFQTDRYLDCLGAADASQISSVFALYFDVVPTAQRQAVLNHVKSFGFDAQTYGGYYLTDVLMSFGEHEFLMQHIDDSRTLWAQMVTLGSSTTWEGWVPDGSLCHAFTAYPLKFCKQMVGIDPAEPAWARVIIDPKLPSTVETARATIPTPRGTVDAEAKIMNGIWSLSLEVPGNVVAEVRIPRYPIDQLLLDTDRLVDSGEVAELPAGVLSIVVNPTDYVIEVCGGSFGFTSR